MLLEPDLGLNPMLDGADVPESRALDQEHDDHQLVVSPGVSVALPLIGELGSSLLGCSAEQETGGRHS